MPCPICNSNAQVSPPRRTHDGREAHYVPCDRRGPYYATEEAADDLPGTLRGDPELIARVGHGVRRMQRPGTEPVLTTELVEQLVATPLPSVFGQANNLIRWLGENVPGTGETVYIEAAKHQFVVGAKTERGFGLVVDHLFSNGFLTGAQANAMNAFGQAHATLTFRGWEYFDQLQRGQVDSRKVFMAMKYGDAALDRIVNDHFRPAVAQTGFELTRLDDAPRAGLIDDRLRVEIRSAGMLIADLSHDNLGAYWEAGFAEGLGKPVIYTCERTKFEEAKTHFDTNHHLTVVWDAGDPVAAAEQLKATIRATLPADAKQADD
jgi:hypothetical protein